MVAYKPPFGNKINKNSDKTPNSRHYIFTQMMADGSSFRPRECDFIV